MSVYSPHRRPGPLLACLLCLAFAHAAQAIGDSWRTPSGKLITLGMSKVEVIEKAGPPDFAEEFTGDNADIRKTLFYYYVRNRASRQAVILTFTGARLSDIQVDIIQH